MRTAYYVVICCLLGGGLPVARASGCLLYIQDTVPRVTLPDTTRTRTLEPVIVQTGYQPLPRERATGAFEHLDRELLNRRISTGILDRLEGVASGVSFLKGDRGQRTIEVRGRSTLFSNETPLVVVDNFPYAGSIDNINPNDVESVTILKDAAAASIWGARAGNGVIVITTKKGKLNQRAQVRLTSNVMGIEKPDPYYLPAMTTSQIIDIERYLFGKGYYNTAIGNTTISPALSPVVEWLLAARLDPSKQEEADRQIDALRTQDNRADLKEYALHRGVNQQYALSLSGGSAQATYYLSGGVDRSSGSARDQRQRVSLLSQQTFQFFGKLLVSATLSYVQARTAAGTFPTTASIYPYERLVDAAGLPVTNTRTYRPSFIRQSATNGFLDWTFNPLTDAILTDNVSRTTDTRVALTVKYPIRSWLSVDISSQYQRQAANSVNNQSPQRYDVRDLINRYSQVDGGGKVVARPIPPGGIYDEMQNQTVAQSLRAQITGTYSKRVHTLAAIAGYEIRQTDAWGSRLRIYGYNEAVFTSRTVNFDSSYRTFPASVRQQIPQPPTLTSDNTDRVRSLFANASYTYANRYTFSGSARKDASNLFGASTNNRAVPLWSVGAKWTVDRERFFHAGWLEQLSLRVTYGYNGNINTSLSAFTTAEYANSQYNLNSATIVNPPNPELRWERTRMINLGIDWSGAKDRIQGSVDYYRKTGLDLIGRAPADPTTGISLFEGNVASMKGDGVDLRLTTRNLTGRLSWQTDWLLNYTTDQVTDYQVKSSASSLMSADQLITPVVGRPVFSVYGYSWAGLDAKGDPQGWLEQVVSKDYTKLLNPAIADLVYAGRRNPPLTGSVRNTLAYGPFSLSANILYSAGYYIRRTSLNYGSLYSNLTGHPDFDGRWQQPGDEAFTHVPALVYTDYVQFANRNLFYQRSDVHLKKGDHIRWQDCRVSYQWIPKGALGRVLRQVQWTAYAQQLGILWRAHKDRLDPDSPLAAPTPSSYAVGLTATF